MTDKGTALTDSAVRGARELVVVFSRLRRQLQSVAASDDLSPSQTSVLSRLAKEGAWSASALAEAERVRPQSMATTLMALDQHGLIRREPDPDDGRRQLVTLTSAGRKRAEGARQVREQWLAGALQQRCTEKERQVVLQAMAVVERITDS